MSDDDFLANEAAVVLRLLGYTVDRIPEAADERADLWATTGEDRLTVEVKARVDDLEIAKQLASAPGQVVTRGTPIERTDPLGRIVRKAVDQITASQPQYPGLGVLWFRPTPVLGMSDAVDQMRANLLGIRSVSFLRGKEFVFGRAFLAARTDFHRFQELDAAVLQDGDALQLIVNPYSHRQDVLRSSLLYRYFDAGGAAVDLDRMIPNEHLFILRSEVDRDDEHAVLDALARQYPPLRFAFTAMHSFRGITVVPRGDDE